MRNLSVYLDWKVETDDADEGTIFFPCVFLAGRLEVPLEVRRLFKICVTQRRERSNSCEREGEGDGDHFEIGFWVLDARFLLRVDRDYETVQQLERPSLL